ncbi:hypothetical protein [Peribacillus simplex]|uniref:Uncharacterized protein n=2 Tax=Peribacillus simplex TaxID=1478 RepID=A0A223EMT2_9BACI|nr:hypothetical protein [Peribacillus simplex]ASS96543.1 hypothetical protein BS1321_23085 [Peribacillus simplex NBRC 15720 = DSM 1321]MEC1397697.1 hypothetical protein [Peribacillus simplex]MED3910894.1 hypothetical protein [Peribacillus simplex]MED3985715.1 hypothetical protein [Peribacillus simplex]MED4097522.1 hypothetical protein [Peribacillus simplex]
MKFQARFIIDSCPRIIFCASAFVVAKGLKNIIPFVRYKLLQDAQAIGQVLFLLTKKIKVE